MMSTPTPHVAQASLLNILQFPDVRLKNKAEWITDFKDPELGHLVDNMFATMYESQGVGLAAIQVNEAKHLMVVDVSSNQSQPLCIINCEILAKHGISEQEEGCLSFPGVYAKVKRAQTVDIRYCDIAGKEQLLTATGLLAVCIQHELDHLLGITFYDHLSSVKQYMLRKKLDKIRRKSL